MSDRDQPAEEFTAAERAALAPYFTNTDSPVFAIVNLPEVVKGALFARYSRSPKSLRRLFLDEFHERAAAGVEESGIDVARAERLYERVFVEYGDDSVAQLGGVHLACENCSNILTKVLEWGRLMAYLEQSTRYVPYTDRPDGRWKYRVPPELDGRAERAVFVEAMDLAFATYTDLLEPMQAYFRSRHPRTDDVSAGVYKRTIRAKALDALRGLLPAATTANVGIYATGQAYEMLLLRMRASPLAEVREYADAMLVELRRVIPAFLTRVDRDDRGVRWSRYLRETRDATAAAAAAVVPDHDPSEARDEVELTDFDEDGEIDVVAAALYAVSDLPDARLRATARELDDEQRMRVLEAYVGDRANRRHRPGRAFERCRYRFDVLTDYGAFRDLQRHRMLTLEWQRLTPVHGYNVSEAVEAIGAVDAWEAVMRASARAWQAIGDAGLPDVASYAVSMAYRVRFYMEMNAREAMHVLELRTAPAGHPAYRRVCQAMHRLIAERAGHRAIAGAMRFVNHQAVELERLAGEQAAERRRPAPQGDG